MLVSPDDWHNEIDSYEDSDGDRFPNEDLVYSKSHCHLHGLTFEEYLVSTYYEQLLLFKSELFQGLQGLYFPHI